MDVILQKQSVMADSEKIADRPKCIWNPDRKKADSKPCGSEDGVYKVTRKNVWGAAKDENICKRHLTDAIKKFNWDTAVPVDVGGKKLD